MSISYAVVCALTHNSNNKKKQRIIKVIDRYYLAVYISNPFESTKRELNRVIRIEYAVSLSGDGCSVIS